MKVVVLSFPRNGTLGLYKAFRILGYNPYHLVTAFQQGSKHCNIIREGLEAKSGGKDKGKPYGKEEFDRWLAGHDVVMDVSAFFAEDLVKAYPDAKFILTHRKPEAWIRSVHNTFIPLARAQKRFPLWHMQYLDPFTRDLARLLKCLQRSTWKTDAGPDEWKDEVALRAYREHNELVRRIVPADRLLVVQLEDGLGWEQICPFLGEPIPDQPYPRANDPNEFKKVVKGLHWLHWRKSLSAWAAVIVPLVGASVWYLRQRQ